MTVLGPLLTYLSRHGPVSSRDLQRHLGLSQATVSRSLARAGQRVIRMGQGRATRYAAALEVLGAGVAVDLFSVDPVGVVEQIATLRRISDGRYLMETDRPWFWLLGDSGDGLFDSLPYFLNDPRPSGYLGRQLARSLAAELDVPADPRTWQDDHLGGYFLRRGDDLPGNLVLGEAAARRVNQGATAIVQDREAEYPGLARQVSGDEIVGTSVAGEQPKFAIRHRAAGHVIVKFSPRADTPEARRWCDLLLAEEQASRLLAELDIPAAETAVHQSGGRTFLESRRFDRHGVVGRSPAISLGMVDAEFAGVGHGWTRIADRLHARGLLDGAALERIAWAETFGAWIGNTDMHAGNLALAPTARRFELLPIYDMLPMALAPVRGELPRPALRPPIITSLNASAWEPAGQAALTYWRRLAADDRLDQDLRALSSKQARQVDAALARG